MASRSPALRFLAEAGSTAVWGFGSESVHATCVTVQLHCVVCWHTALCRGKLQLDVIIFSAAISACEKGSLWLAALDLLALMTKHQLLPNQASSVWHL